MLKDRADPIANPFFPNNIFDALKQRWTFWQRVIGELGNRYTLEVIVVLFSCQQSFFFVSFLFVFFLFAYPNLLPEVMHAGAWSCFSNTPKIYCFLHLVSKQQQITVNYCIDLLLLFFFLLYVYILHRGAGRWRSAGNSADSGRKKSDLPLLAMQVPTKI